MEARKLPAVEFKRGEIILAHLRGQGSVQSGLRPCVIVSRGEFLNNSPVMKVVPLTKCTKRENDTHIRITNKDVDYGDGNLKVSYILCEHEQTIDKSQFVGKKFGKVKPYMMNKIANGLRYAMDL